ncbi:LysE family translocator [Crossiella sp. NPDC003009]
MSLDLTQLPTFLIACAVVVLTPGVDAFLLLRTSLRQGTRAGLLALAGIHSAALVHVALVVSGLGLLISHSPGVLTALRWLGAAYLGFLAYSIILGLWRARGELRTATAGEREDERPGSGPFLRGFLCNITNPKMLLFCLAFLPQFLGAAGNPVLQLGVLAAVFLVLAFAWELAIVLAASRLQERLARPAVLNGLDAFCAVAFLTMSVGLVLGS